MSLAFIAVCRLEDIPELQPSRDRTLSGLSKILVSF